MIRLPGYVKTVGIVLLSISALLCLCVLVFSMVAPDSAAQLHLGSLTILDEVRHNAANLSSSTGFNPVLDPLLLFGAYVLVSLVSWSQERFSIYWENRKRF